MSVEIAWKQNILVTDFHLLKLLLVVFGFGSQAFVCGFSRQNINSDSSKVASSFWCCNTLTHTKICQPHFLGSQAKSENLLFFLSSRDFNFFWQKISVVFFSSSPR